MTFRQFIILYLAFCIVLVVRCLEPTLTPEIAPNAVYEPHYHVLDYTLKY